METGLKGMRSLLMVPFHESDQMEWQIPSIMAIPTAISIKFVFDFLF